MKTSVETMLADVAAAAPYAVEQRLNEYAPYFQVLGNHIKELLAEVERLKIQRRRLCSRVYYWNHNGSPEGRAGALRATLGTMDLEWTLLEPADAEAVDRALAEYDAEGGK